jgi:hypothetical protein
MAPVIGIGRMTHKAKTLGPGAQPAGIVIGRNEAAAIHFQSAYRESYRCLRDGKRDSMSLMDHAPPEGFSKLMIRRCG